MADLVEDVAASVLKEVPEIVVEDGKTNEEKVIEKDAVTNGVNKVEEVDAENGEADEEQPEAEKVEKEVEEVTKNGDVKENGSSGKNKESEETDEPDVCGIKRKSGVTDGAEEPVDVVCEKKQKVDEPAVEVAANGDGTAEN